MEVVPSHILTGKDLQRIQGKSVTCPLCRAQSTTDANDTGWVEMPELLQEPRWLCLGSWIDVASIARSQDPTSHPYYDDLRQLANLLGKQPSEVVTFLRQRQVEILLEKAVNKPDEQTDNLRRQLEGMLATEH